MPDYQMCATGSACGDASNTCIVEPETPLDLGDPCYDSNEYVSLGLCQDSFCDVFTDECTTLLDNGDDCFAGYECSSGNCAMGTCAPAVPYCDAP
jgi:hypothetical protein